MAEQPNIVVSVETKSPKLPDGVLGVDDLNADPQPGCTVFVHYNGPTDQLSSASMGMVVLDPGAKPHDPHRHPEEEFMPNPRRVRARPATCSRSTPGCRWMT